MGLHQRVETYEKYFVMMKQILFVLLMKFYSILFFLLFDKIFKNISISKFYRFEMRECLFKLRSVYIAEAISVK